MRPADDAALLLATGAGGLVIELQGVLFFGNADDSPTASSRSSTRPI